MVAFEAPSGDHPKMGPAFEAAPGPMVSLDAEGHVLEANDLAVKRLGIDGSQRGMSVEDLFDRETARALRERLGTLELGERGTIEGTHSEETEPVVLSLRRTAVDGVETILVQWQPAAEEADRRVANGGTSKSTTRRAGRGGLLPDSVLGDTGRNRNADPPNTLFRRLLDHLDDVVYVIDGDGDLTYYNRTLVETTGHDADDLAEIEPKRLLPEDQWEFVPGLYDAIEDVTDRRVDLDILTAEGDRIPHEFGGTTVEDPETGEVYRCGVARDVTDRLERERELERYETIVETIADGVYVLDENLEFEYVNDSLCRIVDRSREELLGSDATSLFELDDEVALAEETRRRVVEGDLSTGTVMGTVSTSEGPVTLEACYRLPSEPDGEFRGSVGVVRDVTEREARERTLRRQRDELATLGGINELLLETVRELIQTASREAVERTVCEQLRDSAYYDLAWIGRRAFDSNAIESREVAGEHHDYLDEVNYVVEDGSPAARALSSDEVQVVTIGDPGDESWREAAREYGTESIAAVPLSHDDTVFGVLEIHSQREDAFGDHERAGFETLGRTIGFVIHATRSRELLFADAVLELTLDVSDAPVPILDVPESLDCTLELEGYVPTGEDWLVYFEVDGADPADVVEAVQSLRNYPSARVITADEDGGRVELVVTNPSVLHAVTAMGATITRAATGPEESWMVLEAPAYQEIREIIARVRREFPTADLRSRRELDRAVTTVGRPDGLLDALTDRQREALVAAYRAGYFAWPRESSAEEVAASLDIDRSTLHGHLRKAQARLFGRLLEDG